MEGTGLQSGRPSVIEGSGAPFEKCARHGAFNLFQWRAFPYSASKMEEELFKAVSTFGGLGRRHWRFLGWCLMRPASHTLQAFLYQYFAVGAHPKTRGLFYVARRRLMSGNRQDAMLKRPIIQYLMGRYNAIEERQHMVIWFSA